jgi:hypothetical protein
MIMPFVGSEVTSLEDPIPETSLLSEMRPDRDQPKGIGGKHGITSHEQTSSHQYKRNYSIALASSKWVPERSSVFAKNLDFHWPERHYDDVDRAASLGAIDHR